MKDFFSELRRRHVFRIGIAYLVVAWLLTQVVGVIGPMFDLPQWFPRAVVILLAVGFPVALILAWAFESTPEGIKRTDELDEAAPRRVVTTGRRLDFVIIGALVLALGYVAWDRMAHRDAELTASGAPSVAVLPFEDYSPNHDQGYFADGISEEILNSLAGIEGLQVTARTSSFYFKGRNEDLRAIGEKLGVANILEGSVRKDGDSVRITAQLNNARTGTHLWSKTYDRELKDIFEIQEEIAKSVADNIGVSLGVGDIGSQPGMTRNVEAYDEYLAGLHGADFTPEAARVAIAHLERAVALDPDFALAWGKLAAIYRMADLSIAPGAFPNADAKRRQALGHARALAPDTAAGQLPGIPALIAAGNWSGAEQVVNKLRSKGGPDRFWVQDAYTVLLALLGRGTEAAGELERMKARDPLNLGIANRLAGIYAGLDKFDASLEEAERAVAVSGAASLEISSTALATALAQGDKQAISKWVKRVEAASPSNLADLTTTMARLMDDPRAARAELHRRADDPAYGSAVVRSMLSTWAAYFDDQNLALSTFHKIMKQDRIAGMVFAWSPLYHGIRKLEGFKDIMREVGLVDYWRKSGNWGDFCHPVGDDDFECE